MIPGANVTQGRVYSRVRPSLMIVPQLVLGGCTPTPRNDRAASVRMVVAIISGSSTITTDTTFGRMSEEQPQVRRSLGNRRLDVLPVNHGQHLAPHGAVHVGHVDKGDDQGGRPEAGGVDVHRADREA